MRYWSKPRRSLTLDWTKEPDTLNTVKPETGLEQAEQALQPVFRQTLEVSCLAAPQTPETATHEEDKVTSADGIEQ